jgi:DnaJ-class molecular chaperone
MREKVLDCYKALDIPRYSDMKTVKTAYRRLCLKWHPDRNDHPAAKQNMQILNKVYEILQKDKAGYDAYIKRLLNPRPAVVVHTYTFNMSSSGTTSGTWGGWTYTQGGNGGGTV